MHIGKMKRHRSPMGERFRLVLLTATILFVRLNETFLLESLSIYFGKLPNCSIRWVDRVNAQIVRLKERELH